nr:O-antigen ligase family protein [uncultured Flavobacterium sp.]
MPKNEQIITYIEKHKGIIYGLGLSSLIFNFVIGNIFLILLALVALFIIYGKKRFLFNNNFFPIIILFLWGSLSILWSTQAERTFSGIILTLPFLIIPILTSQFNSFDNNNLIKVFRIFGLSLVLYFLVGITKALIIFISEKKHNFFYYHDLVSIFNNNAIYISLFVSTCLLFLINIKNKQKTDYFLITLLSFNLILLSSKNIIFTTFFLLLIQSLMKIKRRNKLGIAFVIFLSLLSLFLIIDIPIKQRFITDMQMNLDKIWNGKDFYDYPITGLEVRIFQWRVFVEMVQNNQIDFLGLGLHNINYLIQQYFNYYNLYKGYFFINFHNQYLQTLGETGIIGLFILLYIFIKKTHLYFKEQKTAQFLIFILIAVSFITESFLVRQKGIVFFVLIFCLFTSYKKEVKQANN